MFEQGYIMREVQKMVQMLQQIMTLKSDKKPDEALTAINENYHRFFDLSREQINSQNQADIIDRCSPEEKFSPDLAFALADFIHEEAKIIEQKGKAALAKEKFSIVLSLYRRAMQEKEAAVPLDAVQKIQVLEQKIST